MALQFGKEKEILYAESMHTCLDMLIINGLRISFIAPSQVKLLFIKETANFEKNLHSQKAIHGSSMARQFGKENEI